MHAIAEFNGALANGVIEGFDFKFPRNLKMAHHKTDEDFFCIKTQAMNDMLSISEWI